MARDPRVFLPLKSDVLLILLAVADRPRHGYAIITDVSERTAGTVRLQSGALYRALKQLLDDGLIGERDRPRDEPADDERRRYYQVTALGHRVIEAEAERMAALVKAARSRRDVRAPRKPRLA